MTILTLRRIREDRFEVTGLADPRDWRPQKGHTGGSGGYGRTG
jgi:hypothetical protein